MPGFGAALVMFEERLLEVEATSETGGDSGLPESVAVVLLGDRKRAAGFYRNAANYARAAVARGALSYGLFGRMELIDGVQVCFGGAGLGRFMVPCGAALWAESLLGILSRLPGPAPVELPAADGSLLQLLGRGVTLRD
ncbi:MAG TPA: hypothetical protein VLI05_05805 [Candidatus Saccharimonadia bacterium]|nr:hypothetical protein [Candidatus Saccharimonadia bacterium]